MKKTFRVLASMMAVVLLCLTSCSEENNILPLPGDQKDVIGYTWASTQIENAGTENEATVIYLYEFNEDGTGYCQQSKVYSNNPDSSWIQDYNFTYTLSDPNAISGKMTLTVTPENGEDAYTMPAKYLDNKLYLGDSVFEKTTVSKEIVGTWVQQVTKNVGAEDEYVATYTYTFKKDGTGSMKGEFFYKNTGKVETEEYVFTYKMSPEGANGYQILITFFDGEETPDIYQVKIDGKTLYLDGDEFTKK